MDKSLLIYLVFGVVVILALLFDLGLMSKKNQAVTVKQALFQTFFWVTLALAFFTFLWIEEGQKPALEYITAYMMEWSLSVDNIFVFILIFSSFRVKEKNYGRVLLVGILLAIFFRIIFITAGVALVSRFSWLLYLFGAFLIYTGIKMFSSKEEENEFEPETSKVYRFLKRIFPLSPTDGNGQFSIQQNGKRLYTNLFVVAVMLGFIDIVFALDSIPAVMGIVDTKTEAYRQTASMVIYTSNIFAVLGLRSLFFLLRGAINKFDYLPQGIAIVLVFIGLKMLAEHWLNAYITPSTQSLLSLMFIIVCLAGSIIYSAVVDKKSAKHTGPSEGYDDSAH